MHTATKSTTTINRVNPSVEKQHPIHALYMHLLIFIFLINGNASSKRQSSAV